MWGSKTTQGSSTLFYPDGLKILFCKGSQIHETGLDINASPRQLFIARGNNRSPKFSPSGNDLLFTSDRGDHSFIGIYSLVTKKIRWVPPEVGNENFQVWSLDGTQVGFIL